MLRSDRPGIFISSRQRCALARRVKRFLLYAVFLALLYPSVSRSQEYWDLVANFNAGIQQYSGSGWKFVYVSNEDWRPWALIELVQLMGLPVEAWRIYCADETPNWWCVVETEADGTATISWTAEPGNEVPPGMGKPLWFHVDGGAFNSAPGGVCMAGYLASCPKIDVPSF